jgi:hypothetical protein
LGVGFVCWGGAVATPNARRPMLGLAKTLDPTYS